MDLIVRFRSEAQGTVGELELAIVGPSQKPARVPVQTGDRFLGLRYRAGWGGVCLGVDPSLLRDGGLYGEAAAEALGHDAQRLNAAKTPDDLKSALMAVGRRRALSPDREASMVIVKAIDLLHLAGGRLSTGDMSSATGMPERTLRRRLKTATGLSCKAFASVLRFQRTMRLLAAPSEPGLTLAEAALEGGYSDQAHMTREFRRYGGFTPGARPPVAFGSLPIGQVAETFNRGGAKVA